MRSKVFNTAEICKAVIEQYNLPDDAKLSITFDKDGYPYITAEFTDYVANVSNELKSELVSLRAFIESQFKLSRAQAEDRHEAFRRNQVAYRSDLANSAAHIFSKDVGGRIREELKVIETRLLESIRSETKSVLNQQVKEMNEAAEKVVKEANKAVGKALSEGLITAKDVEEFRRSGQCELLHNSPLIGDFCKADNSDLGDVCKVVPMAPSRVPIDDLKRIYSVKKVTLEDGYVNVGPKPSVGSSCVAKNEDETDDLSTKKSLGNDRDDDR